jgi:hypothetical protein
MRSCERLTTRSTGGTEPNREELTMRAASDSLPPQRHDEPRRPNSGSKRASRVIPRIACPVPKTPRWLAEWQDARAAVLALVPVVVSRKYAGSIVRKAWDTFVAALDKDAARMARAYNPAPCGSTSSTSTCRRS